MARQGFRAGVATRATWPQQAIAGTCHSRIRRLRKNVESLEMDRNMSQESLFPAGRGPLTWQRVKRCCVDPITYFALRSRDFHGSEPGRHCLLSALWLVLARWCTGLSVRQPHTDQALTSTAVCLLLLQLSCGTMRMVRRVQLSGLCIASLKDQSEDCLRIRCLCRFFSPREDHISAFSKWMTCFATWPAGVLRGAARWLMPYLRHDGQ